MNASRCQVARTVLLSRPQDRRLFQTTSQVGAFGPDRTLDVVQSIAETTTIAATNSLSSGCRPSLSKMRRKGVSYTSRWRPRQATDATLHPK